MNQIVYLLTNPTMSGLVKIGTTENLETRMKQLSQSSSVPVPFECYYACEVENAQEVEKALQDAFGDHRINPKREFFRINPDRIWSILKLFQIRNVTPTQDVVEDIDEQEVLNRERKRRERFRFSLAQIPIGSTLAFSRNPEITAEVVDDTNIKFEDEITSLSKSAAIILQRDYGWTQGNSVQGTLYWMYDNETLSERRERLESEDNEE